MTVYKFAEAAELLGISDDTIRRWADAARFVTTQTTHGAAGIEGTDLARLATEVAELPESGGGPRTGSARNRMRGIVTNVVRDTVMAQVEMCCGPYRIVSLISAEAVSDLGLEVGAVAVAAVKSTNVTVELAA